MRAADRLRSHRRAGDEGIRRFLAEDVLPHLPSNLEFTRVSTISDQRRVAHEMKVRFTHDRELPWLLPGVGPTGRDVETDAVSVASYRHTSRLGVVTSQIRAYRITWDRLDVLEQVTCRHPASPTARPSAAPPRAGPRPG
ncbi:hypothetical protein GCM10009836_13180 [Pseudonocardia ailaonensis]|uniref:Uncharacterized protein n=1 Tax=Pseudonocardia ailaonensis TaxID=367279 RepID=A0ABN2MS97_9PSEU